MIDKTKLAELIEALMDATAHLAAAASAYKTYAKRHPKFGEPETDAFYGTRHQDFDKAVERARAVLRGVFDIANEKQS